MAIDKTIQEKDLSYISQIFPEYDYIRIDCSLIKKDFPDFHKYSNYDLSALYRLYAIPRLSNDLTLYVDADTICRGSLRGILKYKNSLLLENKLVAACSHFRPGLPYEISKLESPYLYFNSGILLFFPRSIEKLVEIANIKRIANEIPEMLEHADQSILNYLLKGQVKWMEYIYNAESWHFIKGIPFYKSKINPLVELLDLSIERAITETLIVHFTALKPWELIEGPRFENEPQNIQFWVKARDNFLREFGDKKIS